MTTETKHATASSPADASGMAAYDRLAPAYREWWAPVIAPPALRLLDRLDGLAEKASATVVDIGAGTGTLALAALHRWPRVNVIGIDPARRMLEIAEADGQAAGLGARLTVAIGSAARLPLDDGVAEAAISSFVFQLVPNRIDAVREAFRVIRPDGIFACLTWRANPPMFELNDVLDDVLRDLGITPPPHSSARERSYRSARSAGAELRRAGFRSVRAREEWLEHRYTPRSYAALAEHWIADTTFGSLDEPTRRGVREDLVRRLDRLDPRSLIWRRPLVSVVARRPAKAA